MSDTWSSLAGEQPTSVQRDPSFWESEKLGYRLTCEGCDECVYIGEGDFACIRRDEPEIVIEGWRPMRKPCWI